MTEIRPRAALQPSYSLPGTSSIPESAPRTFKRRLTSDTPFATATSLDTTCLGNYSSTESQALPTRRDMAHVILPMDPNESDHNATFIHPPFTSFPDAHKYPQGLTYAVMADHLDWFLDANDFTSPVNTNTAAICYPAQLEPPRGWCPAKKKDLKQRGSEGWPDGEEPRLRCTFCRRTYAGVNAKSMWRRHVYEKHKIAMANRRDNANPDRSRRRGSNKNKGGENKENKKHERRNLDSSSESDACHDDQNVEFTNFSESMPAPFTAHSQEESGNDILNSSSSTLSVQPTPITPHSLSSRARPSLIVTSPYDPLVTPTFRHSTPRLPSDQPWRFPSPSHPLHSIARELSLATVVRGEATAVPSNVLDVSPVVFGPNSNKPDVTDSPAVTIPPGGNKGFLQLNGSATRTPIFPKPSPRRLFSLPTPLHSRRWHLSDSPLAHNLRASKSSGSSLLSTSSSIESDLSLSPASQRKSTLMEPIRLAGDDPFNDIYNSWLGDHTGKLGIHSTYSPPTSSPEDSPVVRSGPLPSQDSGFEIERDNTHEMTQGEGDSLILMYPSDHEVGEDQNSSNGLGIVTDEWIDDHAWDEIAPPAKRRKIEYA